MFFSTLLRLNSNTSDLSYEHLAEAAQRVPVPSNDTFGECSTWARNVVAELGEMSLLDVKDIDALESEFADFAAGNRAYARRDTFPNVAVSQYVTSV